VIRRSGIQENIYYTKQDTSEDKIVRGNIVTENGESLAYTTVDYTGNEVRVYPYGNVFAHIVGYSSNGRSGLEAAENTTLLTSHESLLSQLQSDSTQKAQGDTVVVTLETAMQQAAWSALGNYRGAVVVIEPDSGKILAMVSKPDFDPNTLSANWDYIVSNESNSSLLNRALQGLYPPGSTFKILTALAYLREHDGDWESFAYDCEGSITRGDVTINCYNQTVHGSETLKSAFAHSCNTAFASIGLDISNADLRDLAGDFMFNGNLPTTLQYSESVFELDKHSSEGDQMTTAIGQGDTLVTPLHMALITCAVANGGILMKPYCVDHTETSDGTLVLQNSPEIYKELMTVDEAAVLTEFMKETVQSGTGAAMSGNRHQVAAKTGSAEYETDGVTGTHSWFVGFSNADDPDIVVAVIAEDGGTGSSTALPIAQQVFQAYYNYH